VQVAQVSRAVGPEDPKERGSKLAVQDRETLNNLTRNGRLAGRHQRRVFKGAPAWQRYNVTPNAYKESHLPPNG